MQEILDIVDKEIERLNAVKALLQGSNGTRQERPKRTMSVKARKLIAAAQKARWAKQKKSASS